MANLTTSLPIRRTMAIVLFSAAISVAAAIIRRSLARKVEIQKQDRQWDDAVDDTMDCSDPIARY